MRAHLATMVGLSVPPLYVGITILIGWLARRHDGAARESGSNDFLNASRSLPLWVVAAAFLSANCGALEIIGLSAVAAQYGVQAFHFYWIGAIPGLVFVSGVMIPVYMRSGARSLPDYLERRFDARVRLANACLVLVTGTALSGIGLYAMAEVLRVTFGWTFSSGVLVAAASVLLYVVLGGVRATIYNEVFQLVVIVLGLLPLLWLSTTVFHRPVGRGGEHWHLWTGMPLVASHASMDGLGVVVGLGFVLSFSYWCTDFVMIQRTLAARNVESARLVPLLAGFGKLGFSMLVVAPALGAAAYLGSRMPQLYDETLPTLMAASFPPILLGLGMTMLLASLMNGLAANVSAASAVWTEEIYRATLVKYAAEEHYISMGRAAAVVSIVLSIGASYVSLYFRDLMEYVQLIFSLCGAPFFAVFFIGVFTRRATARGALAGLSSGILLAFTHHLLVALRVLHYGSLMSANFYVAIAAFAVSLLVGLAASRPTEQKKDDELGSLVFSRCGAMLAKPSRLWWGLAAGLLLACGILNYLWR
ncbi:MAG: sodium:solute symporter family transporter [Acidobacteriota bacterium]